MKRIQEELREQVRVAKARNSKYFTYADFAGYLGINVNSFYNWLNGYYDLSRKNAEKLYSLINDLL